jgi:hypothetical protein
MHTRGWTTSISSDQAKGRGLLALLGALAAVVLISQSGAQRALLGLDLGVSATTARQSVKAYGELPLAFVPNAGQSDRRVRFQAQAGGASFWFTPREAVFSFAAKGKGEVLRLQFLGANPATRIAGQRRGPGRVNYLLGENPSKWRTGLPSYQAVVYHELWPGIDMVFRGERGRLEYEFRVAPGASIQDIRLAYRGVRGLALDRAGNLELETPLGTLTDPRPVSYQQVAERRVRVESRFVLAGAGNAYGFAVGAYDRHLPLTIDPGLVYSTYLGGSGQDAAYGIAVDSAGNAYVTGFTGSTDFPTTAGAFDTTHNGGTDAFVTKLNASGSALVYSTYLGGSATYLGTSGQDVGYGIAVDSAGSAYVTGSTASSDFPTTAGAFDTTFNGFDDAFVTKLNATGSALVYSTYLGGTANEFGLGIAVDSAGNAYVTGDTDSTGFPTTAGALDTTQNGSYDAFVTKLNATGSALVYSTYLGGSTTDIGTGIAVDSAGAAYVTGETLSSDLPTTAAAFDTTQNGGDDAFVTKLDATGSALVYSSYLGGSASDQGFGIAVDSAGAAYVAGATLSSDLPTTAGAFDTTFNGGHDVFVTKLDATGSALVYSTYLGGTSGEFANAIAVDSAGSASVTGGTGSSDFPTTAGAFDTSLNASVDAFVTKLSSTGSAPLLYSTYLGGSVASDEGYGIALDSAGSASLTGVTGSGDFPTTVGAFDTSYNGSLDAFVTKLSTTGVGAPATLTLSPAADTNPVGTGHTVTATVNDSSGNPVPNIVVRFSVTGSVTTSGPCTTGAAGQCSFTYQGPQLPGADLIDAFADTNGNGAQDIGLICTHLPCLSEPGATATKAWVLPASTAGQASGGGVLDVSGIKTVFGFNAQSNGSSFKGQCNVHVPFKSSFELKCVDVTALVLSGNQATIYGNATENGAATTYVIHAVDNADPGKGADTFSIQTASGYSASGTLTAGNVQVQP